MSSPTQRSKKELEKRGYVVEVVEKWIPGANIRRDLFHMFDLLGIHTETGSVVACQTTSTGVAERVRKVQEAEHYELVRKAGWTLLVHGWRKNSKNRYVLREERV